MPKTTVAILVASILAIAGWYAYTQLSISSGVNTGLQKQENADLKSQVSNASKAKGESEKATIRAEASKGVIRSQEQQSKEKLRESFTSSDDEPLSDSTIIELCGTYNYQDCVQYTSR